MWLHVDVQRAQRDDLGKGGACTHLLFATITMRYAQCSTAQLRPAPSHGPCCQWPAVERPRHLLWPWPLPLHLAPLSLLPLPCRPCCQRPAPLALVLLCERLFAIMRHVSQISTNSLAVAMSPNFMNKSPKPKTAAVIKLVRIDVALADIGQLLEGLQVPGVAILLRAKRHDQVE